MLETAEKTVIVSLIAELIDGGGKSETEIFDCKVGHDRRVNAGVLKAAFLRRFNENGALVVGGQSVDPNQSYHLLSRDETGLRTACSEEEDIEVWDFERFELVPRTVGGTVCI